MSSVLRAIQARPRLFIGFLAGLCAWALMPLVLDFRHILSVTRFILAWDFGVLVFLIGCFEMCIRDHLDQIPARAEAQQEGQRTIFLLTLLAVLVSFVAIIYEFANGDASALRRDLHVALVAATLVLSWLMCQTTFALHYAHEYYDKLPGSDDFARGLQFPDEQRPDYWDFLYFAIVIGMTFQVSDVQISSRKLRRLAMLHGLLGFFFNTVILALTVNIAAGLLTPPSPPAPGG